MCLESVVICGSDIKDYKILIPYVLRNQIISV